MNVARKIATSAKIPAPDRVRIQSDPMKMHAKIGLCGFPDGGMHVARLMAKFPGAVQDFIPALGRRRSSMKVLLATDGSTFSGYAIDACRDLIDTGMARAVKIVSVYEAQVPITAEPMVVSSGLYQKLNDIARDRTRSIAKATAETIGRERRSGSVEITTKVALGDPAAVIVETAAAWNADLIIVGSHGRGFWGRLALGSVSDRVLHNAPCSVLVVREKPARVASR
jgi:nucleotide-binding universal stress UspA family protein